jgi:hypothetical protein
MKVLAWIASATIMAATTVPTIAQEGKIVSPGGLDVIVWRTTSVAKVLALLRAKNLDARQFIPLMACEVRSGTAAVMLSRSRGFYNVKIVQGPQSGCRGAVTKKMFVHVERTLRAEQWHR